MLILKILLVLGICAGGYTYYQRQQEAKAVAQAGEAAGSSAGFVSLPAADGHDPAAVIVVAPQGCTMEDARRAEQLADGLSRAGVRVQKTNAVNWSAIDPADIPRISSIMNGRIPIVFVGGKAKNNPSLDDVLAATRAAGL